MTINIVKLGGSLEKSRQLSACLNAAVDRFEHLIIVPGGGSFADLVRQSQQQWQFDDVTAHEMAILAMQQMALLCHSLRPDFSCLNSVNCIQSQAKTTAKIIWSPDISELNQAGVSASWDISSDSLAAWLATQLQATRLTLIKTATFSDTTIAYCAKHGIIDHAFLSFIQHTGFKINIVSADKFCLQPTPYNESH